MSRVLSWITRALHLGISIIITLQLLVSTFMALPRPGHLTPLRASVGFDLHELVGIFSLPVLLLWFAWLFVRRDEAGPGELFPWFRQSALAVWYGSLRYSLRAWKLGKLADTEHNQRVAQSVHGLGALCGLGMASSGLLVWLGLSPQGHLTEWAQISLSAHRFLANLMWAYWGGHVAMAIWHQWQGDSKLKNMFHLRRI
ncbi:MAG: cytochrome b/b6 domain-containing protein [Candidatus Thiodiazotropha sp.]